MRLLAILLLTAFAVASCQRPSPSSSLNERVDSLFGAYEGHRPGYAIGIVRGGELVHATGYGSAQLVPFRPIGADTPFNVASLSKQFTAAAVALEVERGQLSLDDALAVHWPDLPEFMHGITIAHLVYMTSGLPEYYTLTSPKGGWNSEDRFTVADSIDAVLNSGELLYEPGTQWSYSNINYQLLAELVARLNNVPFSQFMKTEIFDPLDMDNTWVDAPLQDRAAAATAYVWEKGWKAAPRLSPHYGGSGVFTTLNDLAKWDRALYTDLAFGASFSRRMLSTRRFEHDKDNDAFGLVHGSYQGQSTIWYEGGDYGVSSYMSRLPQRDETVICLSNFGNGRCFDKAHAVIDLLIAFDP